MNVKLTICVAILVAAMTACGGDDGSQGRGGTSTRCTTGETRACTCADGAEGSKSCGDDRAWGDCQCGGVQPDVIDDDATPACTPACEGKACGFDGCSGTCGTCGDGQYCADGACVAGTCTPACADRQCGDDGCGGLCGACDGGKACVDGRCEGGCTPACADKSCGPDGCGGTCGACPDGQICQPDYSCKPGDCTPDCAGRECGDDGCGGSCGACDAGCSCDVSGRCAGACTCTPSCAEKHCGDDGCGGSCGTCGEGKSCDAYGRCEASCECLSECSVLAACGTWCGECGGGAHCSPLTGACVAGGDCADLLACAQACLEGVEDVQGCVFALCDPSGANMEYTALLICVQQVCSSSFTAACANEALSGSCASHYQACAGGCSPGCLGKQCGPDGCGGSCGSCSSGYTCDVYGACQPGTADPCNGITYEGCCSGTVTKWCENNAVQQVDCTTSPQGSTGTKCGWDTANNFYYCVSTAAADPSGTFPYACP